VEGTSSCRAWDTALKPRLLDLFCGLGGATLGYQRAGFHVTGVDLKPQPHYIGDEFIQANALTVPLDGYDVIHASPPCQEYSIALRGIIKHDGRWERLLEDTRQRLEGTLHVIENVPGAPIPSQSVMWGNHGIMLCGTMFDLGIETPKGGWREVRRHRLFESTAHLYAPEIGCRHRYGAISPYGAEGRARDGIESMADHWYARAMGIDWVERGSGDQLREAIPPAYTQYIGTQLMTLLRRPIDATG
jgi:DNA (cytosine-5)-methyltransferase 1